MFILRLSSGNGNVRVCILKVICFYLLSCFMFQNALLFLSENNLTNLPFCIPANPFEKLVRQEQLLHCTSIHAHLTNNRVNVNVEVKTTIKQLNLYLENYTIRAKGRIINSELPLDATTPLFLPNKSHLVDLLINHIHSSHHHVGLSQTLSLYRLRCWTPRIRSRIKSLFLRCVTCQRVKGKTLPRPLPLPCQQNEYDGSLLSHMSESTILGVLL